ncbi:hypothetical protein MUN82_07570 [Hymenobacter aerilatus]|uniref:T9SS type A sorting domain-containing protein n=1 Tax=Hymenobacter aerilatus TaxID=2932251 RepID=A0A8T9T006_9BACT|nr:hypothetical protein [Hymenobacter aerilatus]UOR06951.1 hypothetical protein MUN82_07570 [Hymenobacter aerilatus]
MQKQSFPISLPTGRNRLIGSLLRKLTAILCVVSFQLPLQAQVLINESFKNSTTTTFTLRNDAVLTANNGGGTTDTEGNGYLRLTSNGTNQRGAVISNAAFPAAQGFNISFEFFAYTASTSGADGFSVFLIDGATPLANFTPGAFGSSLGYAPATTGTTTTPGATNGYLGIGLDEFGGFNTNFEGRTGGGATYVRNTVAIRGNAAGGYALLTPVLTTSNAGGTIGVSTTRAQSTSTNYRRATISVTPTGGTYRIIVRIQNGTGLTTAINSFLLPTAPPATLRLGLAASTGSSTNTHEVRNLYVVVPPTAQDDNVVTPNNTPITISILDNDNAANSTFDYSTIDLDPSTIAIEQTRTVTGGTFRVNANGTVTFTPSGTGSVGAVSIPYLVSTNAVGTGTTAVPATPTNPATITVQVGGQGTDIATSVTAPRTVTPSSTITYTVTTTNIGTAAASTVRPTLTLSQGLSPVNLPAAYSYANGVVTFPETSSLAAGTGSVSYTVSFTAPSTISTVTGTARATTSSTDVNANNNNGTAANSVALTDVSRPLPVELVHFKAVAAVDNVQLTWRTASERNNAYFQVESSLNGHTFSPVGRVRGHGTSSRPHDYAFTDASAAQYGSAVVYYRLRQVDGDGTETFSSVRAVQLQDGLLPARLQLVPNPAHAQVQVLEASTSTPIELLDLTGRIVRVHTASTPLPLTGISAGVYVVRQGARTARLVVQ